MISNGHKQTQKLFDSQSQAESLIPENVIKVIKIGNDRLCIVRKGDKFFCFEELCPHLGESFSKGTINNLNEVVCPWHSYRFNLVSGEESSRRCRDLKIYRVEVNESGVFLIS